MRDFYKYLVINSNFDLVVVFPVALGDTIGLDNTCMADEELRSFYLAVYDSLTNLKDDIEIKYFNLSETVDQVELLVEIHRQACQYIKYISEIKKLKRETDLIHGGYRYISKGVLENLSADPHIGAIRLDPMMQDDYCRFGGISACTFGIRRFEGKFQQILSKVLREFFRVIKPSIIDNHNKWKARLKNIDSNGWKKNILNNILTDFQGVVVDSRKMEEILDLLNDKFQEIESMHHPEQLFKNGLKSHGLENTEDYDVICEYFKKEIFLLKDDEHFQYEEFIEYLKFLIEWDAIEVSPERVKGVFEEIHESGEGFEKNMNAKIYYEERMSIAIQFLIGTINLVLKEKGKTDKNFGMVIEGVCEKSGKKVVPEVASSSLISKVFIRCMLSIFLIILAEKMFSTPNNFEFDFSLYRPFYFILYGAALDMHFGFMGIGTMLNKQIQNIPDWFNGYQLNIRHRLNRFKLKLAYALNKDNGNKIDSLTLNLYTLMDKKNISFVDQLSNHIIEWVNKNKDDFSIIGGISHEDQKDINRLFNANFKTIMASPHFDEFLIRQEGGWIWKSIEGRIATDFRNVVNKTLGLNRETELLGLEDNLRFLSYSSMLNTLKECGQLNEGGGSSLSSLQKQELWANYQPPTPELRALMADLDPRIYLAYRLIFIEKKNLSGITTLEERKEAIRYYLKCGGNLHKGDIEGRTVLMRIVQDDSNSDFVKALIEEDKTIVNDCHPSFGYTPLILAARHGNLDIIKELVASGADVNAIDCNGDTALLKATFGSHNHVVKYLMNYIDNINHHNQGFIALGHAIRNENKELVKLFIAADGIGLEKEDSHRNTMLMYAIGSGNVEIVRLLIGTNCFDVNKGNVDGYTALMFAVGSIRYLDIVKELMDIDGLDINKQCKLGETALMMAVKFGYLKVVKILVKKHDIDLNMKNKDGKTALDLALEEKRHDVAKVLMDALQFKAVVKIQSLFRGFSIRKITKKRLEDSARNNSVLNGSEGGGFRPSLTSS